MRAVIRVRDLIATAALRLLDRADARRARNCPARNGDQVKILLLHAHGMGGTIRTVLANAGSLAHERNVEVVSVLRGRRDSFFPIPPGVRVSFLDDRTRRPPLLSPGRLLSKLPSVLVPKAETAHRSYSLWTDVLLVRYLRSLRTGIVMGTRPSLNLIIARFAPPGVVTIAQEHVHLSAKRPELRKLIRRRYPRLDAVVTLTEADLRAYRRALPGTATVLTSIPNAVPPLDGAAADPGARTVVTVGRLAPVKRLDRLVRAWEQVAARHPGWTLRIVGSGPEHDRLRKLIGAKGLTSQVCLAGRSAEVGRELSTASIFAMSSRLEGFPLALLEAMSKGLPAVSFDCRYGPREIITHGHDGLLVPNGDVDALAGALCALIEDDDLRRRMGERAADGVRRYDSRAVAAQWEHLFDKLTG